MRGGVLSIALLAAATVMVAAATVFAQPVRSQGSDLTVRAVVPGLAGDSAAGPYVYLAMGDSLATGFGASDPLSGGYVGPFFRFLAEQASCAPECARLELLNLGVSGATSSTLLEQQLPSAVAALGAGHVAAVTIDIGANDAVGPLRQCVATSDVVTCLGLANQLIADYRLNLDVILGAVRAAAGPTTPILVMTYYNPLAACFAAEFAPAAELVLEGGLGIITGLNDVIREVAATYNATIVETYGLLGPADLVGGLDCLHPNDAGYALLTNAFEFAWAGR